MKTMVYFFFAALIVAPGWANASRDGDPGLTRTGTSGPETSSHVLKSGIPCPPEICPAFANGESGYLREKKMEPSGAPTQPIKNAPTTPGKVNQ